MKKPAHIRLALFIGACILGFQAEGLSQQDSTPPETVVKLRYFNENNSVQFISLESNLKVGKTLTAQKNKHYSLLLADSVETPVAKLVTNEQGVASTVIPPALKDVWNASSKFNFIARDSAGEIAAEMTMAKARILIDTSTADSIHTITATVQTFEDNEWKPVPEVEMKLGVARMGGILSAGDEESYTTDSSGVVTVELTKKNIPGDGSGMIMLAARVDDNDLLGNLHVQKKVKWGVPTVTEKGFFEQRTLWSTRTRTPFWLLFMAYSIILGVWGTLIYLVFQLVKVIKLGKSKA